YPQKKKTSKSLLVCRTPAPSSRLAAGPLLCSQWAHDFRERNVARRCSNCLRRYSLRVSTSLSRLSQHGSGTGSIAPRPRSSLARLLFLLGSRRVGVLVCRVHLRVHRFQHGLGGVGELSGGGQFEVLLERFRRTRHRRQF